MPFKFEERPYKKRQFNSRAFISSRNSKTYSLTTFTEDTFDTLEKYLILKKTRDLFYSPKGIFVKEKEKYKRLHYYDKDSFVFTIEDTKNNQYNLILDESYEEVRDTVFTIPYEHLSVQQETYIYALNKNSNTELHVVKEKGEVTDVYFCLYDKVTQPYIKNNISSFLSLIN